jgi:hypothetical protein
MNRWIDFQIQRTQYPGKLNKWLYPWAQFSLFCYSITIGTIDSKGTPKIHSICAIIFFLILYITTINVTCLLRDMRKWDSSIMSK